VNATAEPRLAAPAFLRGARAFVFLQGLATPFFARLGGVLRARGHAVTRVNFNGGDAAFWPGPDAIAYRERPQDWPDVAAALFASRGASDLVVFGDCRPQHEAAIAVARAQGLRVHVFEEAYIRPGWITLERDGVNARSRLPRTPQGLREAAHNLPPAPKPPELPASFALRAAWDVLYHAHASARSWRYPHWTTHRAFNVWHEYLGWTLRGARRPARQARSQRVLRELLGAGAPYWAFPLQLEGDYQIRVHSPYETVAEAIRDVVASFARGAPAGTRLAIKGHPLDNGLNDWARIIRDAAQRFDVTGRIDWIPEAPFGPLLAGSRGVVTVNSTAGLQAIGFARPVLTLGAAIYAMPGLTFQGPPDAFWQDATPPDPTLYDALHRLLAARAMVRGGFFHSAAIDVAVVEAAGRLEA
jgi:capsular polysaccharide export protein